MITRVVPASITEKAAKNRGVSFSPRIKNDNPTPANGANA